MGNTPTGYTYAKFRTDKPVEPGFTAELMYYIHQTLIFFPYVVQMLILKILMASVVQNIMEPRHYGMHSKALSRNLRIDNSLVPEIKLKKENHMNGRLSERFSINKTCLQEVTIIPNILLISNYDFLTINFCIGS
jgi:hypothetical protein